MARAQAAALDGNATQAADIACTTLRKAYARSRDPSQAGAGASRVRLPSVRSLNQLLRALGDGAHLASMATVFECIS